jgi:hypothetical protein
MQSKASCSLKGIRQVDARADFAARVPRGVQFERNKPRDSEAAPVPAGGNQLCRAASFRRLSSSRS